MKRNLTGLACACAGLALIVTDAAVRPAAALPAASAAAMARSSPTAPLTDVQWRRGRGGGWGWFGPGPAAAIAGGVIIGGAIVASAIAENRANAGDMRRCARDFPSFDPRSGTIIGRGGEVRICPYLY